MEGKKTPIYFRLPADLDRELRELADREERSLAGQLRHLIREAVERSGRRERQSNRVTA